MKKENMEQITSKILTFLILVILITSCGPTKKISSGWYDDMSKKTPLVSVYNKRISVYQLDSICVTDGLSQNLADWNRSFYIDYEDKDTIYKYTFIKTMNEENEDVYILSEYRDSLVIHKRIKKIQ